MDRQRNELFVLPDLQGISKTAAERMSAIALDAVSNHGQFHLVLAGGRTPEFLYRLLSSSPYKSSIPWPQTHVYWGDERCVPPENDESNFGQAWRIMLNSVPVQENHIHRIRGELEPQVAADEYRQLLAIQSNSGEDSPRFDLVFLGMGDDGHTASLFPGPIRPEERSASVMAVTAFYEDRPSSRITMTPRAINRARNIFFLVTGSNKSAALAAALNGPEDLEKWPVRRIRPVDGSIVWLADQESAALTGANAGANL